MGEAKDSPYWYRVAALRPRLRAHSNVIRQVHRGETWYVLEDQASGRFHRLHRRPTISSG